MNHRRSELDAIDVIANKIIAVVDRKISKLSFDKTFPSVIYGLNSDGTYTIIKANQKYNVKCAIPGLQLGLGSNVWVKIPSGRMQDMHICGVR